MSYVSTEGLSRYDVLAALYNGARTQGLGFNEINYDKPINVVEAEQMFHQFDKLPVKSCHFFCYVNGRTLNINLSDENGFDDTQYDAQNGVGTARMVIERLYQTSKVNDEEILDLHKDNTYIAAEIVANNYGGDPQSNRAKINAGNYMQKYCHNLNMKYTANANM